MTGEGQVVRFCLEGVIAIYAAGAAAHAQVLYGALTGNVSDPGGSLVPGVRVEAASQETNVKHEALTNERGIYRFTDLQPGLYRISVTTGPPFPRLFPPFGANPAGIPSAL